MGKHIADTGGARSDASRLENYTDIERKSGDGQSAGEKALHRQKKTPDGKKRVKRFVEMDRRDN